MIDDVTLLDGRPFALLLMGTTANGEDDWAVFAGIARVEANALHVDRGTKPRVEIRAEWVSRIRPVEPAFRRMLQDADYYLPLTVGKVADDEDHDLLPTGLKWPD